MLKGLGVGGWGVRFLLLYFRRRGPEQTKAAPGQKQTKFTDFAPKIHRVDKRGHLIKDSAAVRKRDCFPVILGREESVRSRIYDAFELYEKFKANTPETPRSFCENSYTWVLEHGVLHLIPGILRNPHEVLKLRF